MYRLTIPSKSQHRPDAHPKLRRVYRWGEHWGVLMDGGWSVERRRHLSDLSSDAIVVDEIQHVDLSAPPLQVEDVWDEEVFQEEKGGVLQTFDGNLLSVLGTAEALGKWCVAANLSCPPLPASKTQTLPPPRYQTQHTSYRGRDRRRKL